MEEISSFGMKIHLIASTIYPAGLEITQFADDADPFDAPATQLADKGMGLNGDLVVWSGPAPIEVTINVIPDSQDDLNLSVLAEANRVSKGKNSSRDVITLTRSMPGRSPVVLTNGKLTSAVLLTSAASTGRKKTKPYTFVFEGKAGV